MSLLLYPEALRHAHGEEMRQAFRDRCREVAQGRHTAWRLVFHDLIIDSLRAAWSAHLEAGMGASPRRTPLLLALLVGVCAIAPFQDRVGMAVSKGYRLALHESRRFYLEVHRRRWEAAGRQVADSLLASSREEDHAIGAWLLASNHRFQWKRWPERLSEGHRRVLERDIARAQAAFSAISDGAPPLAHAAALAGCSKDIGCNDAMHLRALAKADPQNGFAATQEFRRAYEARDVHAMAAILERASEAKSITNYRLRVKQRAMAAAVALRPDDTEFLARFGRYVARNNDAGWFEDWRYNLSTYCVPPSLYSDGRRAAWSPMSFMDVDPAQRTPCTAVARLMVDRSDDTYSWNSGQYILRALDLPDARDSTAQSKQFQDELKREWPSGTRVGYDWPDEAWAKWVRATAASSD